MSLIIVIAFNFVAGLAIAEFIYSVQSDFWQHMFNKYSALEADEMQDNWYANERVIYLFIILFGYIFMALILFGFFKGRIRKIMKKLKNKP